ncbi:MAG: methyltransferase, FxLD system, partial [Pseudonocardiaceae bacterium]
LGAVGHGLAGTPLAERLCEQIRAWDRDRTAQPVITAYPADTPDNKLTSQLVINKQYVRLVISA